MRTLAEFTKTTLIGGVLIILPIYIAVLLLAKAVKALLEMLAPVTAQIPAGVEFRQAAAILLLIAVCFVVGLVVRTGPGLRAKNAFEQAAVLEKLPGYSFLRGLAKRLTGRSEEHTLEPALVEIEDALVPALIVEETGRWIVHGPRSIGADADGRQHLHLACRQGAIRSISVHQGDRRVRQNRGTAPVSCVRAMKAPAAPRGRGATDAGPS